MDSIVYTRIKELCDDNGITVNKLENELGLGQYSIGGLKNSSNPTIKTIAKVAKYFNVSVDYLIGASDIRTTADELVHDRDFVSLQRAREKMTDVDKSRMMAMLQVAFDKAFDEKTNSVEEYLRTFGTIAGGTAVAAAAAAVAPIPTIPLIVGGTAAAVASAATSKKKSSGKKK